jgi:hypothetical protein
MQQGLALFRSAIEVVFIAVFSDLRDMPAHRPPAFYLALIIFAPSTQVISAIPLKPSAGIFIPDPPFSPPLGKRL